MTDPPADQVIRSLRDDHRKAKATLKNLARLGRVLSIVLIVVFVGFLTHMYGKVTTMYAPEQFEKPLQEEARNLLPKLEPQLRQLWTETAPVYGEMAMNTFQEALPAVREASVLELEALRTNLIANAHERVGESLDRISRRQYALLAEHFPKLSAPEQMDRMGEHWMESITGDLEQILVHFEMMYAEDLGQLAATLDQFRGSEYERMSEDEVSREFIHLWLMKLDRWVLLEGRSQEVPDHDG